MVYSVEPLPGVPEKKKNPDHPTPLVRLTVYGTEAALLLALVSPIHDLPYGLPTDKPHTETQEPSTRVNDLRTIYGTTSSAAPSTGFASFGKWRLSSGST
jgi:hypothetical protein